MRENELSRASRGGSNGWFGHGGPPDREGAYVPLSEEEQRILQELEQKLYEHDRAFVDRVRAESPGASARRSVRWSAAAFIAGFAVVLVSFRSSLLLGTFGFVVMLFAALLFERSARLAYGSHDPSGGRPASEGRVLPRPLRGLRHLRRGR